jgi:hypothetical protein
VIASNGSTSKIPLATIPRSPKAISRHFNGARLTSLLYSLDALVDGDSNMRVVNGDFRRDAEKHIIAILSTNRWSSSINRSSDAATTQQADTTDGGDVSTDNKKTKSSAGISGKKERSKRWTDRVMKSISSLTSLFDARRTTLTVVMDSSPSYLYDQNAINTNGNVGLNPVDERKEMMKWIGMLCAIEYLLPHLYHDTFPLHDLETVVCGYIIFR